MRIALIVPYFGKFPENFQMVLNSCKYNDDLVDWLFYTNDRTNYNFPSNCKVFYCEFEEIKQRIEKLFEFSIALNKPYKLCDYRPAYGQIFESELQGYDFWGHCDIDCIFGKLSDFLNEEILKYERVFRLGHMCLYRNNKEVNKRYMLPINNIYRYKEVFQNEENCIFDEYNSNNDICIDTIWNEYNFSHIYFDDIIANIYYKTNKFILLYQKDKHEYVREYQKNSLFFWEKGRLYLLYLKNNKLQKKEFIYIHFMKRNMQMIGNFDTEFLKIVPNKLIAVNSIPRTVEDFKRERKYYFSFQFFSSRLNNIKIKVKKCINRKEKKNEKNFVKHNNSSI
ncbi:MAG: DUF6625 family protein [Clostridia bacterium]